MRKTSKSCKHCQKFNGEQCELLGIIDEKTLKTCHLAGYDTCYNNKLFLRDSPIRHSKSTTDWAIALEENN